MKRQLTGKWYLRKTLFGFKVMVQVAYNEYYFLNLLRYEEATTEDLAELNIKIY